MSEVDSPDKVRERLEQEEYARLSPLAETPMENPGVSTAESGKGGVGVKLHSTRFL